MSHSDLPVEVALIADIIGRERALYLAGKTESTYLTIPQCPSSNHKLVQLLSLEEAKKLSREYTGWVFKMPSCRAIEMRWQQKAMNYLFSQGLTMPDIAEIFLVSRKTASIYIHQRRIIDGV